MLDYILFLSCLEFAIRNSTYFNTILKPKQVICLEHLYLKRDVICVLPTGYGKSLIFHLLPGLLFDKEMLLMNETFRDVDMSTVTAIVIVVSPLNALINNQISRLGLSGIRASVLGVKMSQDEEFDSFDCDLRLCDEEKLRAGHYHIIFAHPESFISCKYGRELLQSQAYQEKISAIVIDEAHCILEWYVFVLFCFGYKYRTDWNRHAYIYTL